MPHFCLPGSLKPGRATWKVEQNLQKSEKCSARLPSPKRQCGLRLRSKRQFLKSAPKAIPRILWVRKKTDDRNKLQIIRVFNLRHRFYPGYAASDDFAGIIESRQFGG